MVERELPFSRQTAWRFMTIASAQHLQMLRNVQHLPSSWGTLAVLARLDVSAFEAAIAAKKISPDMTRAEAEALLPSRLSYHTDKLVMAASIVREVHCKCVESVFQVGRVLLQAKQALPHGEFQRMVGQDLPFGLERAHCYMSIASTAHLQRRNIVACLPSTVEELSVLARLDPATFTAAVAGGKIYPEMTSAEAEALLAGR